MKITQEELQRRLNSSSNLVNKIRRPSAAGINSPSILKHEQQDKQQDNEQDKINKRGNDENNRNNAGRKEDIPNAPPSLRLVAGILSHAENNSASVARGLNLTPGQVRYADKVIEETLTEKKVQEIALNRLMDALGLLSLDRIENETPKTVSTIAANLSRIHSNLKPKESGNSNNMNVILYSPKVKNESDFECIEVQSA